MKTQAPTKIALLGFDGSQQASMELFLCRHIDGFELVPEKHASAIIFNADQAADSATLQQDYRQQYNKPGVLVSIQSIQWPGMISLQKPYGTKELTLALQALKAQMAIGSRSPVDQPETSAAELQKVLDDFRASVHKGEELLTDNNPKIEQKKAFQQGLMDRKRRAEQLSKGASTEKPIEQLSDLLSQQTQTLAANDFEHDLLAMTEEVIADNLPEGTAAGEARQQGRGVPLLLDPSIQDVQDSCGNQPDCDLTDLSHRRHVFFNPEGQLFAMALEARNRGRRQQHPQSINGLPGQKLYYDPETDQFLSSLDYEVLLQMAQARFGFGELQLQSLSDGEAETLSSFIRFSGVALLWRLACYTAKGRLKEGISFERKYRLSEQLPSNVIIDLPRTSALIRLWQSEPLSALEVMEQLHVEQRFVFPFMTAAVSLGWLS